MRRCRRVREAAGGQQARVSRAFPQRAATRAGRTSRCARECGTSGTRLIQMELIRFGVVTLGGQLRATRTCGC